MAIRRRQRRGMVLLVVISLLVIFMLMTVTYIVISGQYLTAARQFAQDEVVGDDPQKELDNVFYQLLRDTRFQANLQGPVSSLSGHSLYFDLYGIDSISRTVTSANYVANTGNQFVTINFPAIAGHYRGDFNGAVLTMFNGPARNLSTRIVDSNLAAGWVNVEAFMSDGQGSVLPQAGNRLWINGRPFNGTGAGFDPGTGKLDQQIPFNGSNVDVALMPNYIAYLNGGAVNPYRGGADESYDAVDFQNMFLAMVPPSGVTGPIIPSFHRPSLVNYWSNHISGVWSDDNFKRAVMMRPIPALHKDASGNLQFDGSNPNFNPITGPWDVDNDFNGIPDSIWIDAGLAVKTSPDGRRYKPLVAILCQDLDGRLSLNAAGSLAQPNGTYATPTDPTMNPNAFLGPIAATPGPFAPSGASLTLPRGAGVGPADTFLGYIFNGNSTEYTNVLKGRYGTDGRPGVFGNDQLSSLASMGIGTNYSNVALPSNYASPHDVWGREAVALDFTGHPYWVYKGYYDPTANPKVVLNPTVDEPYEINLTQNGGRSDTPYSAAELERLLRWNDFDAVSLNDRITRLAPNTFNGISTAQARRRSIVTTDSRHLPVPNVTFPAELRNVGSGVISPSVIDLFRFKLSQGGVTAANMQAQLNKILPWELRHGQLFDINRPWGNGRDDNGNFVVDDVAEAFGQEDLRYGGGLPAPFNNGTKFNYTNDLPQISHASGPQTMDRRYARQIYARHLYCLMMFLKDKGYNFPPPTVPAMPPIPLSELTAERIAQWAINVVDFRDPDAIMTPFEYDKNPYNGWQSNIDGDLRTNEGGDRRVVWGTEAPDLLLTETLAFHDRRVKDTKHDATGKKRKDETDPNKVGEPTLDQFQIPQGSLFIELYCPRGRYINNPIFPRELYNVPGNGTATLDLGRLSPSRAEGYRQPVWRVVVKEENPGRGPQGFPGKGRPPGLPGPPMGANPPWNRTTGIDRIIWFTPVKPTANHPAAERERIFYSRTANIGLAPAHYAVIGPRKTTYLGAVNDGAGGETRSPQKIVLNGGYGMARTNINGGNALPANMKAPLTLIAAADPPAAWISPGNTAPQGIGVSLSEPLPSSNSYYTEPVTSLFGGKPFDFYEHPDIAMRDDAMYTLPDDPFDDSTSRPLGFDGLTETGTKLDYKTLVLQRLANPMLAWNPEFGKPNHRNDILVNPYIDVDRSEVDLTVFNGNDRKPGGFDETILGAFDPSDPEPNGAPDERFAGRERGSRARNNPTADRRLWPQVTTAPAVTGKSGPALNYFRFNLVSTMGHLNFTMGSGRTAPPLYIGDPTSPFPWLTWNNRPFASPLEMMLVPSSSPQKLLKEYRTAAGGNPYDDSDPANIELPFRHLLNFYHTSKTANQSPHFHRLFDYIETPSPFVGSTKWYNPTAFAGGVGGETFRPPYNKMSRFRDPGRVNINTIFDPLVWRGLAKGFPAMNSNAFWDRVTQSRQGYGGSPFVPYALNSNYPTRFGNPVRAASAADLMPTANMRKEEVQATLLRSNPNASSSPLFDFSSGSPHNHTGRNPAFRYQGLTRLNNLVSTHSNVYAIWITVGYFEVTPGAIDAAHPDGWRLGQEIGLDSGNVERHRAFYIIDRSIPVAFQPGENHNVDKAVLLRRFIE